MKLSIAQLDRACGTLLGTAAGDALGGPYEFGPPRGPDLEVAMVGGGSFGWEPGEWTDDTSMAVVIAQVAATGADLRQEEPLDAIVKRWHEWSRHAKDVGVQTRSVLSHAGRQGISAQTARAESAALHKTTGRTAGNGSLMRTAPVALAYLDDEAALVEAARAVGELTHYDPEAGDACVLWCCAIRHAILTGQIDARIGLQHIDMNRRDLWASRLNVAEASKPSDFTNNGWVVEALQAAWCAIATTPVPQDDPANGVFELEVIPIKAHMGSQLAWQLTIRTLISLSPPEQGWDRYKDCYTNIAEPGAWTTRVIELETLVSQNELAQSEPGRHSHYAHRQHLAGSTINGHSIRALCGVFLVPTQDHENLPRCPECQEQFEKLRT